MRTGGVYVLYVVAMGSLGVAAAHVGGRLTDKVVASTNKISKPSGTPVRRLSRVEKHFAAIAVARHKERPTAHVVVMAMTRPDIHPGLLAAQMDRVETAVAPEPARVVRPIIVAQVAGVACSAAGCTEVQLASQGAKLKRLPKGLVTAGNAKSKALKKAIASASKNTLPLLGAGSRPVRYAETPGDIIKRSLSGII